MKYLLATAAVLAILGSVANAANPQDQPFAKKPFTQDHPFTQDELENMAFEMGYVAMNCKPDDKATLLYMANKYLKGVGEREIRLKMMNKEIEVKNGGGLEAWCETVGKSREE